MSTPTFSADIVAAVTAHMNDDHTEDSLLIVQTLGGIPDASEAVVDDLDDTGVNFSVIIGTEVRTVRLPWERTLQERAEIRQEFVRMYREAARQAHISADQERTEG